MLPGGAPRPGTTLATCGDLPLLVALTAQLAGDGGAWAVVGLPELSALPMADAGLDLTAGIWVDHPGRRWPEVVATLAEQVPVTLLGPVGPPPERVARRIGAVLRRSGTHLLTVGEWPGAAGRLRVSGTAWEGLEQGLLSRRRATVTATGRGPAHSVDLWLPGPDGRPAPIATDAPVGTADTGGRRWRQLGRTG